MYFHIQCVDKPNSSELRAATRDEHIAYLKGSGVKVAFAGPTTDEADEVVTGSVLVIEAADRAAAEGWAAGDPYAKAGLFSSTTVTPIRNTIPGD